MSSASQLLFGIVQGEGFVAPPPESTDLSELILEDLPIFYWQFYPESQVGNTLDATGNGFDTTTDSSTPIAPIRGGVPDSAGHLDINDNAYDGLSPIPTVADKTTWTIECVVKVPLGTTPAMGYIFGQGTSTPIATFFAEENGSGDRRLRVRCELDGFVYTIGGGPASDTGEAVHITATRDGDTLSFYFNGVLAGSRNDLPALFTEGSGIQPSVGAPNLQATYSIPLDVSDAAMYDYVLSDERILRHYQGSKI